MKSGINAIERKFRYYSFWGKNGGISPLGGLGRCVENLYSSNSIKIGSSNKDRLLK